MAIPTVISRSDLDRMRNSVKPATVTETESRRLHLKKLSDERVKHWPNTLEALREKKLLWKKEKEDRIEKERQEIDKKEAEIQRCTRVNLIKRANEMLYQQTDNMKNLRSQLLYSDVCKTRLDQIEEKKLVKDINQKRDKHYYDIMVKELAEADKRTKQEEELKKEKSRENAKIQQEQLEEFKLRYIEKLKKEKAEGEKIKKKAEEDIIEERRAHAEKLMRHKIANEEMKIANLKLKALKLEMESEERAEDDKRKAGIKAKSELAIARKKLEAEKFEAKQQIRQRMIDRACARLAKLKADDDTRMENQAKELRDKEDAEMNRRNNLRKKQWDAIDYSRKLMIKLKEEKRLQEIEANKLLKEKWSKRSHEVLEEEARENAAKLAKNMEVRKTLEEQMKEKKEREADEAMASRIGDARGSAVKGEDEERFKALCMREIEKAKEKGKPTWMIEKCLHNPGVVLLSATGMR